MINLKMRGRSERLELDFVSRHDQKYKTIWSDQKPKILELSFEIPHGDDTNPYETVNNIKAIVTSLGYTVLSPKELEPMSSNVKQCVMCLEYRDPINVAHILNFARQLIWNT